MSTPHNAQTPTRGKGGWPRAVPPLPVQPLYQDLDEAVRTHPDGLFLDFLGRTWTYREVGALVDRAARGLQNLGVKKGDRVGLLLPNTPWYVILFHATLKAGGIVVNFNPLYAERELAAQIRDSGATVMATVDVAPIYDKLARIRAETPLRHVIVGRMAAILPFWTSLLYRVAKRRDIAAFRESPETLAFETLVAARGTPDPVAINPVEDVAVLQYTGGTTGLPKGAMLTHANLVANVEQSRRLFPALETGRERMLGVLPLFHVFAMTTVLNVTIAMRGQIILLPRFDLAQVIRTIHKKRPTLFPAVPTIYTAINHYKDIRNYDLSSIKYCISGGAPLPVEVKRDFEKITGCVLVEGYGLSETSPVVTCNPFVGVNKEGSIGLPLAETLVEIVALDDPATVVAQGERGEVCVRGPQVMKGYWNQPGETAQVLRPVATEENAPAWASRRLHTGDVGIVDADGYVFIVDRLKDMIAAGGFKVYPRNVEEAIYLHPAVAECIVAGVPDPYRGQTVKAYIVLREGHALSKDALASFLKDKLSPIEMPKLVEFRDTLPKTAIGKLSRKALLEEEAAKAGKAPA